VKIIALVEDNADNRLLVSAILEDAYHIVEYEDGTAALRGIPETSIDLVLLDISLPELDGVEVMRRLAADERTKRIPVIALTAHAGPGDQKRFMDAGFSGYVTKPITDENVLLVAIARLLG
jgi:CheY-like chemotaxis protein